MTFADLLAGVTAFLDANTLVYALSKHPRFGPACVALLERIERQEFTGITSTHLISEAAHRLMALEVMSLHNRPQAGIAPWMRNHPDIVQGLTSFRPAIESIPKRRVQIFMPHPAHVEQALALSQHTGLLHNDALLVAIMQEQGLSHLASNDPDFDRVPGITRYAPV
jgi:predicted nucleic acid-binding protein